MDQSTDAFEGYYQPKNVRKGLTKLAFGLRAGDGDDELFDVLRKASLKRDSGAPIYVSEEYFNLIKSRSDMRRLLEDSHQARVAGDDKSSERYRLSHLSLKRHLSGLALTQQREEYFNQVDDLRLNGKSTADLSSKQPNRPPGRPGASTSQQLTADIARFMGFMRSIWEKDPNAVLDDEVASQRHTKTYVDLLVRLQSGQLEEEPWLPPASGEQQHETAATQGSKWASEGLAAHDSTWGPPETDGHSPEAQTRLHGLEDTGAPRCLVCGSTLFNRSSLTRHYVIHVNAGYFNRPFKCPECCRLWMEDVWIKSGKSEYSSHVERVHGKVHASYFPSYLPDSGPNQICCIICGRKFNKRNALIQHCRGTHAKKEKLFDKPFQCPECSRRCDDKNGAGGDEEEKRTRDERALVHGGVEAWIVHIRVFHGESVIVALPAHPSETPELKRKHACDDSSEPTIEATSNTDDCCKRPKTCPLNNNFDSRSGSGDRYCLDVAEDRMAARMQRSKLCIWPLGLAPHPHRIYWNPTLSLILTPSFYSGFGVRGWESVRYESQNNQLCDLSCCGAELVICAQCRTTQDTTIGMRA